MSNIIMIPGPGAAEPEKSGKEEAQNDGHAAGADCPHEQQYHGAGTADIPTEEECLRGIARVASMVALGIFKPSVANTIRNSFRDILQHYRTKAKESEKKAVSPDIIEALRKDPKMLSLLEPFLSQDEIESIMKKA